MTDNAWHRNPWVWLVIAIPAATVIGCLITILLAIKHPHIMVDDSATSHLAAHGSAASRTV